ncbi:hypothetical protein BDZ94DRAFT_1249507 [Collybia nuda]|uniref:FAD/NAD(P)-binding domain-containing protein n=1 Tax=Collybia nuda TaxID=64659 RepID=A0A9P6CNJ9_9AGAR|nr:hypothetical protein BDZ94DRAFT_1249507 [Collybia nuda]
MGSTSTRTVVVLGSAYGGSRAAQILAAGIPEGWRIILIDRNSHTNHVYILPRLAVLPGHEYKAFIPNTKVFLLEDPTSKPHIRIQAHVTSITPYSLTLSKAFPEHGIPSTTLPFDYVIYALGSHLPRPLNLWASDPDVLTMTPNATIKDVHLPNYRGEKAEGVAWLSAHQKLIESSPTVLVVGGGALGIQFTTDIAAVHPTKQVTLLHSRDRLLPRFDEAMHAEILKTMETFSNIDVILGERLDLESVNEEPPKRNEKGQRVVRTVKGREIAADLIMLCTGQTPNTELLTAMDPATVNQGDKLAHVLRTMQLGVLPSSEAEALVDSVKPVPVIETDVPEPTHSTIVDPLELETALKQLAVADLEAASTPEEGSSSESTSEGLLSSDEETLVEPVLETPYPNMFVIGDAADAFGAIPAGHNAYYQGELAARNIIRLIKRSSGIEEPLELYKPGAPAIKVTLGLGRSVYQLEGNIGVSTDQPDDLHAAAIWAYYGIIVKNDDDMRA